MTITVTIKNITWENINIWLSHNTECSPPPPPQKRPNVSQRNREMGSDAKTHCHTTLLQCHMGMQYNYPILHNLHIKWLAFKSTNGEQFSDINIFITGPESSLCVRYWPCPARTAARCGSQSWRQRWGRHSAAHKMLYDQL